MGVFAYTAIDRNGKRLTGTVPADSREAAMDQVMGVMIVLIVLGLLADKLLFAPWERFLHRRWGTGTLK